MDGPPATSRFNLCKREQVLNRSEMPQNRAAQISAISCYLGHEFMIFQRQKFC